MLTTETQPQTARRKNVCREIPLEVVSCTQTKLHNVPMTAGLCIPKGQLFDAGSWLVEGFGGAHIPAQTEVLNRWSDGSVRWLLTRFVARRILPQRTTCVLLPSGQQRYRDRPSAVAYFEDEKLRVRLGPIEDSSARESVVDVIPELLDADGESLQLRFHDVIVTQAGSVFNEYTVSADVVGHGQLKLSFRLEVWPTVGLVKVETRLRNTQRARHDGGLWDLGDSGSMRFSGLNLTLGIVGKDAATEIIWKAEKAGTVRSSGIAEPLRIRQYGSGGPAWANGNHRSCNGESTVLQRGYEVHSSAGTFRGYRSSPIVATASDQQQLTIAMPEFWQQFPSGVAASESGVVAEFFPATGEVFELQGGEQKTSAVWLSTRPNSQLRQLDWVYVTPRIIQPAKWIKNADVFAWLPGGADVPAEVRKSRHQKGATSAHTRHSTAGQCDERARFFRYINEATTGAQSFHARRDRADEYGWRNFGDVHADHEQPHYDGFNTLASHYNNQFDLVFGGILNLAVSGDAKWFDLFEPLARHVIDIDIYHTQEDRACFNGGLFWHTDHFVDAHTSTHRTYSWRNKVGHENYGGGPSNEHNYTTGLLYYHFLTGNRDARDAVLSLADWVIAMDDGSKTIWGAFDSGPTGLASQTVFEDFHGPGRGAGNSINALLDAWILTQQPHYMEKAEELIRRVVHPEQDCHQLHLSDAEGHWSYTVCLVAIGRYLGVKLEAGQTDENYDYARASLQNFGHWMLQNEKPALSEPEKLTLPTVAWAAQEFRKANALRIAASCIDDPEVETSMRRKADELHDAAWADFYSFGTSHVTARCLSIVMTEGLRGVFHRDSRPDYFPPARGRQSWGRWEMFVPQKQRVRQLLRNPVNAMLAAGRLLNPRRVVQTIDALRRQM